MNNGSSFIKLRYKKKELNIKCNLNEKIVDVCKKCSYEINTAFESKIFFFDGEKINIGSDLTLYEKINQSEFEQENEHELLIYDDPDKCHEGISNLNEIEEVSNNNNSQNLLFPKYGGRLYNEYLEEKIPNSSDNNNKKTKTLSDENENDLSKLLLKDEKVDTKEKDNTHNDENIKENNESLKILGENEVKEDKYEIERKNPKKREEILLIYSALFLGALGKFILTYFLSNIEINSDYALMIIIISALIVIFICVIVKKCMDDMCYCCSLSFFIIYNITYISFFTSLKILTINFWQFFFDSLLFNYGVILLFFLVSKSLNLWLLILLLISCGTLIICILISFTTTAEILDFSIIPIYIFFQNIGFITFIYGEKDDIPLHQVLLNFHSIIFIMEAGLCDCYNYKVWVSWGSCCCKKKH